MKGKKSGKYKRYDKNGNLREEGDYMEDNKQSFKIYYEDGKLYKKGFYKNFEYDGPYEEYDPKGQITRKGVFQNGEFVPDKK